MTLPARLRSLAPLITLVILALIVYSATFIVTERDQAIQLRFGEIQRVITKPGIYFKLPTNMVDTVQIVDKRLNTLEIDNTAVRSSQIKRLEAIRRRRDSAAVTAALAAAQEVLAGEPDIQGSVSLAADGTVRVTTSTSVDTVLLSLIGITRLPGNGNAAAQLYD